MNGVALATDRFGNTNSAYSFDGVNDFMDLTEGVDDDMISQAEDTITTINKFVDGIKEEHIDNEKLKTVMKELYVEALNQEQA
jgi:hypothetical protein